ncbi:MAG: hypothetical protein Q8Q94_00320 [bacterium]|nr:hypothetical protein [bacterium]MDZ4299884.1 hypothetical protein [Candidatus Sungbacteria bacterium]
MPLNPFRFSEKARTYYGRVFPRIELVAAHIDEEYSISAAAREEIMRDLAKLPKKIAASASTLGNDAAQLRAAYAHLNGRDREKWEEMMAHDHAITRPLKRLLKDGITTWEQVKERATAQQRLNEQEPPLDDSTARETEQETPPEPVQYDDPRPASPMDERSSTTHPFLFLKALASASATVLGELGRVAEEVTYLLDARARDQRLLVRQSELETRNAQLTEQIALLEETRRTTQKRLAGAEHRIQILTQQVKELAPRRLEELAELFPSIPALFKCADDIREEMRKREDIVNSLPTKLLWLGNHDGKPKEMVSMVYHPPFKAYFSDADHEIREAVIKQIHFLCEEGPHHKSLDTKRNKNPTPPHTPDEHMYIRIKIGLRATCSKEGSELHFYNIIPRGDL